jgi:hypothetical protein
MVDEDLFLMELTTALDMIRETFDRKGFIGIQGFSITAKTDKSSVNLKWGDLRIKNRKRESSDLYETAVC